MEFWTYLVETAKGWSMEANVIRFVFALLAGTLIGIDREYKNRGAGIKTHVLVCLGSAMVMMTSHYIAVTYPDIKSDVTRIPAQVISGIGFLGVATIIVTGKTQVFGHLLALVLQPVSVILKALHWVLFWCFSH